MTPQGATNALSLDTLASGAINVYVGLRLSALQSRIKADSSALEVTLLKQFVAWKDDVLSAINGKYVSEKLIGEIRTSVGREMSTLSVRMDHIEKRCEDRPKDCIALRCHPPE